MTRTFVCRGIRSIHPAFRLVALAEPPQTGTGKGQWLTPEILSMFLYHDMRSLSEGEELEVLAELTGRPGPVLQDVLRVTHKLRTSEDASLRSISTSLSTRQLIRVARRLQQFPDEPTYSVISKACLSRLEGYTIIQYCFSYPYPLCFVSYFLPYFPPFYHNRLFYFLYVCYYFARYLCHFFFKYGAKYDQLLLQVLALPGSGHAGQSAGPVRDPEGGRARQSRHQVHCREQHAHNRRNICRFIQPRDEGQSA